MSETLVRSLILIAGFLPALVVYGRTAFDGPLVTSWDAGSYSGFFAALGLIFSLQGSAEPFSWFWRTYPGLTLVVIFVFLIGLLVRYFRKTFGSDFHALLYFLPGDRKRMLTTISEVLADSDVDTYRENGRIYLRDATEESYLGVWRKGFNTRVLFSNEPKEIPELDRVLDKVRRRYRRTRANHYDLGFVTIILVFLLAEAQIVFEFL